ncbi:hypothetical protein HYDPIDRAFT_25535 [Hydnomerulius pinastri MD-312]|nr:hypothetical protein HYDPIDRAFT_25535 [Hydnomerulius pinastri MD-312]
MASTIDVSALPRPGTQFFLPSLLGQVRAAAPGLPLEPVIIQVLLLCIISGDRNLILRTRDEDIGLVTKLTTLALNAIFGYNVHKLKCHSDAKTQTPSEFLRSLFFPPSTASNDGPLSISHKHRERHRRTSSSRNPGGKLPVVPPASISTARSRKTSFSRSISYPSESKPSIATPRRSQLDPEELDSDDIGPKPNVTDAHSQRPGIHPSGVHTEPSVPTLASNGKGHQGHISHGSMEALRLPSAVVVSGLEHASLPAQKAVLRTFADRKFVLSDEGTFGHDQDGLVLELPEQFLMVYVCRSDSRERPPIYKSLLDRFAMSSPVIISPQTRLAMRQYRPPSSPSTALSSPHNSATSAAFPTLNFLPGPPTPPPAPPTSPAIPAALLRQLKVLCATQARIRHPLNIYLADLFTAARHYGALDGMLLTTRARQDAEALVRATRVLGIDHTGSELIKDAANGAPRPSEVDTNSTERGYPHSHSSVASLSSDALLDGFEVPEIYEPSGASSSVYRSFVSHLTEEEDPLELDVSEADIARMFPRVVSHRLRVRDSPVDEVLSSAVCGAVSVPGEVEQTGDSKEDSDGWQRDTVKEILVHILAEV